MFTRIKAAFNVLFGNPSTRQKEIKKLVDRRVKKIIKAQKQEKILLLALIQERQGGSFVFVDDMSMIIIAIVRVW
jgi:hypothetical protein